MANESYETAYRAIRAFLRVNYGAYLTPAEMRTTFGDSEEFLGTLSDAFRSDHEASVLREAADDLWNRATESPA